MKMSCEIIKDLLPLYADKECSEESKILIKEHLNECVSCKNIYEDMKGEYIISEVEIDENLNDKRVIKKYINQVKFSAALTTTFLISIVFFWIVWFLKAYAWIKFDDNAADVLSIILFILAMVMVITGLGVLISVIKEVKETKKNKKAIKLTIALFLGLAFHMWMISSFSDLGYNVSAVSSIVSKNVEGEQFFFSIKEIKTNTTIIIECDKKVYEAIEADENIYYSMEYRKLVFIKSKGYLGDIDTIDFIDNRNK